MLSNEILNKILLFKPFYEKNVLENIYSFNELENLINLRPFMNDKRVYILNNEKYSWNTGDWLTDNNTYPPDLFHNILKKNVVYLRDCSRVNSKINYICKQLEDKTNFPTDAHIFFSLKEKETDLLGLGKHKDTQHNLVLVVEGSFNCKVWLNNNEEIPLIDIEMKKNDIIFVPAGFYHQVIPYTKRLSISFPMAPHMKNLQERYWIKL